MFINSIGWAPSDIFLVGYGQGGTVALDLLLQPLQSSTLHNLGGVIGIATEVLPERLCEVGSRAQVFNGGPNVLLLHGAADMHVTADAAQASAECLRKAIGTEH